MEGDVHSKAALEVREISCSVQLMEAERYYTINSVCIVICVQHSSGDSDSSRLCYVILYSISLLV